MSDYIVFQDGTEFIQPVSPQAPVHPMRADGREWRRMALANTTAAAVKAKFVDGVSYSHQWDSQVEAVDGEGNPVLDGEGAPTYTTERVAEDLSEYSVAGDIVDTRDGNITVYMGKPTDLETAYELLYGGVV